MESPEQVDIRRLIRAHGARQLVIARLNAPTDWERSLRNALQAQRHAPSPWAKGGDIRLFLQSFAIFFTATMMFLI